MSKTHKITQLKKRITQREAFFKEDTPMEADRYRLRESEYFLQGRSPVKPAVSICVEDKNFWDKHARAARAFLAACGYNLKGIKYIK